MEDNKWFRKNEQGKQCLDHWRWGVLQFYTGSLGRISLRRWLLGTYLKEKRELAKQTSGVFKVGVAGLRNERRMIGDEVRWIMESHITQGLVEHLKDCGFWVRLSSCRSEMVVAWMSVMVKVVTSSWSLEWSCLNFPTVLDGIWKTGVKDNSSSIKMIKAVGDQFARED